MSEITPLYIAARNGYTNIVALLIDNGGDVNLKDKEVSYNITRLVNFQTFIHQLTSQPHATF